MNVHLGGAVVASGEAEDALISHFRRVLPDEGLLAPIISAGHKPVLPDSPGSDAIVTRGDIGTALRQASVNNRRIVDPHKIEKAESPEHKIDGSLLKDMACDEFIYGDQVINQT